MPTQQIVAASTRGVAYQTDIAWQESSMVTGSDYIGIDWAEDNSQPTGGYATGGIVSPPQPTGTRQLVYPSPRIQYAVMNIAPTITFRAETANFTEAADTAQYIANVQYQTRWSVGFRMANSSNYLHYIPTYLSGGAAGQMPAETDEEQQTRLRHEAADVVVRAAANDRAERLLTSHLNPTQVIELKHRGRFRVILPDRREFVIERGRAQNVWRVENGKKVMRYCAHPGEAVPDADSMLAQFLMLKHAPQLFEEIANKTPWDGVRAAAGTSEYVMAGIMNDIQNRAFGQAAAA